MFSFDATALRNLLRETIREEVAPLKAAIQKHADAQADGFEPLTAILERSAAACRALERRNPQLRQISITLPSGRRVYRRSEVVSFLHRGEPEQ